MPGLATGIGSLPHEDPRAAVEVVLEETPRLPFAPELPMRSASEGMVAQWAGAPFSVISGGVACLVSTTWLAWRTPELRNYRETPNAEAPQ